MIVAKSRILQLIKLQSSIFNTTFNPTGQKLGNSILRQRLKGTSLAQYYPPRVRPIQELRKAYPDWLVEDETEDLRLESIRLRKQRGKGAPKKRRSAAESKRFSKRKPGQAPA